MKTVLEELVEALELAKEHLEYIGYGDRYERECARDEKLPEKIEAALARAKANRGSDAVKEPDISEEAMKHWNVGGAL